MQGTGELQRQHDAHKERMARLNRGRPHVPVQETRPREIEVIRPKKIWFYVDEETQPRYPRILEIVEAVADYFQVSVHEILSQRRPVEIVLPRQIAMYLCRALTLRSLPEIGRYIGDRDHTTVLHATRKIQKLVRIDWVVAYDVAMIETPLRETMA